MKRYFFVICAKTELKKMFVYFILVLYLKLKRKEFKNIQINGTLLKSTRVQNRPNFSLYFICLLNILNLCHLIFFVLKFPNSYLPALDLFLKFGSNWTLIYFEIGSNQI